MTTLTPKPGFDWNRLVWSLSDRKPPAICSYCQGGLGEVPLMMWNDDGDCVAFCNKCARKWWGLRK